LGASRRRGWGAGRSKFPARVCAPVRWFLRGGGNEDRALAMGIGLLAVFDDIRTERLLVVACPQEVSAETARSRT